MTDIYKLCCYCKHFLSKCSLCIEIQLIFVASILTMYMIICKSLHNLKKYIPFLLGFLLCLFSCLIIFAKASSMTLKRSWKMFYFTPKLFSGKLQLFIIQNIIGHVFNRHFNILFLFCCVYWFFECVSNDIKWCLCINEYDHDLCPLLLCCLLIRYISYLNLHVKPYLHFIKKFKLIHCT